MSVRPFRLRGRLLALAGLAAATLVGPSAAAAEPAAPVAHRGRGPAPTVVLVHGAWADGSSWTGVVQRLQRHGYPVRVFANPLRSLSGDAAALRDLVSTIQGPVVLVGHSYGGAVITNAAKGVPQVKALVYVDAFAPAAGQTVLQLVGARSVLAVPDPSTVFDIVPVSGQQTVDLYVKQDLFVSGFANDLPERRARLLAATQRPITLAALSEPSGAPAWQDIPSWYQLGTLDRVIPPDAQAAMARTAGARVVRVRSGHLPMVSAPDAVTRVVEAAATSVR